MGEILDYKKVNKALYSPGITPEIIDVPEMKFIAVEGRGNPNNQEGAFSDALAILYALSFTIKMSKMGKNKIKGYFEYVVPPLESYWWFKDGSKIMPQNKDDFCFLVMIRQPDFVTEEVFRWASEEVYMKKSIRCDKARLIHIKEAKCVQILHKGSYDNEKQSIMKIDAFMKENNLKNAIGEKLNGLVRNHHEIYLSDPRKSKPENLKTIIRIPVK